MQFIASIRQKILGNLFPSMKEDDCWMKMSVPDSYKQPIVRSANHYDVLRKTYAFECDFLNIPENPFFIYNLNCVFASNNLCEYVFDFTRNLSALDMKAILSALSSNSAFSGLILNSVKLERELALSLAQVLRINQSLKRLILTAVQASSLLYADLFKDLDNCKSLECLVINDVDLNDVNVNSLASWLEERALELRVLNMSNCNIKKRNWKTLLVALKNSKCALQKLDFSDNHIGNSNSVLVSQFLANQPALTSINLSNCNLCVDVLLDDLARGKNTKLISLNISRNMLSIKNAPCSPPMSNDQQLSHIDMSGVSWPINIPMAVIKLVATSTVLKDVKLSFSNTNFVDSFAAERKWLDLKVSNVSELDVSDNLCEDEMFMNILEFLKRFRGLKSVNISRMLATKGGKDRRAVLDAISRWFSDPKTNLKRVILEGGRGSQLGADLSIVASSLADSYVEDVNFSGHNAGILATSAMVNVLWCNKSLSSVVWKDNMNSLDELMAIGSALQVNKKIQCFLLSGLNLRILLGESNEACEVNIVGQRYELNSDSYKSSFRVSDVNNVDYLMRKARWEEKLNRTGVLSESNFNGGEVLLASEKNDRAFAAMYDELRSLQQELETRVKTSLSAIEDSLGDLTQKFKNKAVECLRSENMPIDQVLEKSLLKHLEAIDSRDSYNAEFSQKLAELAVQTVTPVLKRIYSTIVHDYFDSLEEEQRVHQQKLLGEQRQQQPSDASKLLSEDVHTSQSDLQKRESSGDIVNNLETLINTKTSQQQIKAASLSKNTGEQFLLLNESTSETPNTPNLISDVRVGRNKGAPRKKPITKKT